jgi:tRNA (mo5U34)-methyltransferase
MLPPLIHPIDRIPLPLFDSFRPLFEHPNCPAPEELQKIVHSAMRAVLRSEHWKKARALLRQLRDSTTVINTHVTQGIPLPSHLADAVSELIRILLPWRTGPYQLCDLRLDTEWVSEMKWSRVEPLMPTTLGLRIADIGCSNGFFLFKMQKFAPELAIGFDPVDRCWLQFILLQLFMKSPRTTFVPAGLDTLTLFPNFFDLMLCMGVVYHQRDPFTAVRTLHDALRPGGKVILESLTIPVEGPYLLVPPSRYAKMRNAWHIPSADALAALLERAGFVDVDCFAHGPLTTAEQRRTELAPYESLADFLDPNDPSKTVEQLPAPHTAVAVGFRR